MAATAPEPEPEPAADPELELLEPELEAELQRLVPEEAPSSAKEDTVSPAASAPPPSPPTPSGVNFAGDLQPTPTPPAQGAPSSRRTSSSGNGSRPSKCRDGGRPSKSRDGRKKRGGVKNEGSLDFATDADMDAVLDRPQDDGGGVLSKIRGGTKVKQGPWQVKGAAAKIKGEGITKSASAAKQRWVVGRITADADAEHKGQVLFKYATPKKETREEWVSMKDLEQPESQEVKEFEGRTIQDIGMKTGFTKEQLAAVKCTKGMTMKLKPSSLRVRCVSW